MLLWMATTVTLLAGGSGDVPPEARVAPQLFLSSADCKSWKANMQTNAPVAIDPASGKQVMGVFYECTPVDSEKMIRDLQKAQSE